MLTVSGVGWRSCPSCQEIRLRLPEAQSAPLFQYRLALYRTCERVGLSAIAPAGTVMTLIQIDLASSGCSMSRGDQAIAKMEDHEFTGSITPKPVSAPVPTETDLAFARNAASDVL